MSESVMMPTEQSNSARISMARSMGQRRPKAITTSHVTRRKGDGKDQRLCVHRLFLQGNEQHGRELKDHHRREEQARVRAHQRLAHALGCCCRAGRGGRRVEAGLRHEIPRPCSKGSCPFIRSYPHQGRRPKRDFPRPSRRAGADILRPSRHRPRRAGTGAFIARIRRVLSPASRGSPPRGGRETGASKSSSSCPLIVSGAASGVDEHQRQKAPSRR